MLAIIGGTGLYKIADIDIIDEISIETIYGKPSTKIVKGQYGKNTFLFLARHGKQHNLLPHEINYRANILALKKAGATRIISISAVGSLQEEIKPGDFAIPAQYFDWLKGNREKSFFGNGLVAHISTANPACLVLTNHITNTNQNVSIHTNKTYACVDGPRLGTKAESNFLRKYAACDLVGMTNIPEVFLAREAGICYNTIGIATDYDCWKDNPEEHVTAMSVIQRYQDSMIRINHLLKQIFNTDLPERSCNCHNSLQEALMTDESTLSAKQTELLNLLRR